MTATERVLSQVHACRVRAGEYRAHCPAHADATPSLSITETDGRVLLHCHAGCSTESICSALGLTIADLFDVKRTNGNGTGRKRIVSEYRYLDEKGAHLYDVIRFEPKDFRQRRADGAWNLDGVQCVLYRLPELLGAECVFIAEGEKDVDSLHEIGITATCNPGGAGKWRQEYTDLFKPHQQVVILPDNDSVGRKHAHDIAASLYGKVASVRILDLPGLPDKGDVSDWLREEDSKSAVVDILRLAEAAPEWSPNESEKSESFIEYARTFLTASDPPMVDIIPGLIPQAVFGLSSGDPRTMKSLAEADLLISASTATPAFGLERLRPSRPYLCLYCSQEDRAPRVRPRFNAMLRSRGIHEPPDTLAFAVFKGIDLDSPDWQERFFEQVVREGFELVSFDPLRGFTANADAGPKEVLPIAKFFRRLMAQGITVRGVHHWVKPPSNGQDSRRRGHKASGGGWFSVSECPISFEKISEGRSLVTPEDFKFSSDPRSFTITYHEEPGKLSLVGEDSTAEEAGTLALDEAVIAYVAERPGVNCTSIVRGVHRKKDAVLASLDRLFRNDRLDCAERGRAKLWTLRKGKP